MAGKAAPKPTATGILSVLTPTGPPVSRDNELVFIQRKSRVFNTHIPAAAQAGVSQAHIADLQNRTLAVCAPEALTHWPGSVRFDEYLQGIQDAHDRLDSICEETLELSFEAFYGQARLITTQSSLYSPRLHDIQQYRKQIVKQVEDLPAMPVSYIDEDNMIAEAATPSVEAVEQWNHLKTKLQSAAASVQTAVEQRKPSDRKSVRFSTSASIREFDDEAEAADTDWEETTAIADLDIDLDEVPQSKLCPSNQDGFFEVNGKLPDSFALPATAIRNASRSAFFSDTDSFERESTWMNGRSYGNHIDPTIPFPPVGRENCLPSYPTPISVNNTTIDPLLLALSPPAQPAHTSLAPYTYIPGLTQPAKSSPFQTGHMQGLPTPPPSSPLAPVPISKAPGLKSILVRKSRNIDIYIDDDGPPAKRRKPTPDSFSRPATPPLQGIEFKPPVRPFKKPPTESNCDGALMEGAKKGMNGITKDAKDAAKMKRMQDVDMDDCQSKNGQNEGGVGDNDSGFGDESTLVGPFDEGWGVMTGSP